MKTHFFLWPAIGLFCSSCNRQINDSQFLETISGGAVPILSINEILFDPIGDGVDFVEIVNTSDAVVDLKQYSIGNRNAKGEINTVKSLTSKTVLLKPGGYCLLTADTARVREDYGFPADSLRLEIKSFPSYPNESGYVLLLDKDRAVVDEFDYSKSMHHTLVTAREGISLEKRHPRLPSSQTDSWTSASAGSGFGTPGRRNSQYWDIEADFRDFTDGFYTEQTCIYPMSQSRGASLVLHYRFSETCLANIRVYDSRGLLWARIADNLLLGTEGCIGWDGTDGRGEMLPYGRYLVRAEYFSLSGFRGKDCFIISLLP